jgi:hypothetical protein
MMLVSLQRARDQLHSDIADDDAYLTLLIKAASRAVVTYLKAPSLCRLGGLGAGR